MKFSLLKLQTKSFFFLKFKSHKMNINKSFYSSNNILLNYLNFFIKQGKKLPILNVFFKIFFFFFYMLKKKNLSYAYTNEFLIFQTLVLDFFNINFLMQWYTNFFNFFFFLNFWKPKKVKSKRKKLKQKSQPKFNINKYLILKKNKFKIIFKLFYFKIKFFKNFSLKNKLLKLFLDIILNLKESWLYKFKLNLYNHFLFLTK